VYNPETVQKIKNALHYRFRPLRLYREELSELLALFKENCETVNISDGSYVYDSLDEMKDRMGSKAVSLEITGVHPYIDLTVGCQKIRWWASRDENTLYSGPDAESKGEHLFLTVREFVLKHQRVLPIFVNMPGLFFLSVVDLCWLYLFRHFHLASHSWGSALDKIIFAVVIPYDLLFFFYSVKGFSDVSLERRIDQPSFWKRNQDDILKYVIGGIIGAAIQWGATHLSK